MSDDNVRLFDDEVIRQKVAEVWEKVFAASNKVIGHADLFGFSAMEIPDPNIHQMLLSLQVFTSVIDILIAGGDKVGVDADSIRLLINAKAQITRMERVAVALKADDRVEYDAAMKDLESQAAF